ncbi:MAG: alpha/beta hydrolase [Anaerolineae bacterium]|nr:alpha/beta hydrolase [Anaerolineae bacterium]
MLNNGDITTWPEATVKANDLTFHYWRTGKGDKPALVLCHGFSDNGLCWTPVARALENDYDVLMVDARGHGLSDAPETGYTTEDRVDDLAAFIKALALDKPAVLGHSMGGATASFAAAKYPDLIGKVLLEDPGWWDEDNPHQTMNEEERMAFLEEQKANLIAQKAKSRAALIAGCRANSPTWSDAELGPWAISKQQLSPNVLSVYGQARPPWREIARKIQCSALLITADVDKGGIVTPKMAQEAPEINPKIHVVHIEGAGHNVRREAFQAYMAAVKEFLSA